MAFHNAPKNFLLEDDLDWKMVDENEDSFDDEMCEEVLKNN